MTNICFIHHKLSSLEKMGGSEAVLFGLINEAACEHEVTLIASGAEYVIENLDEIDTFFGTKINDRNISHIEVDAKTWDIRPFGIKSYALRQILFSNAINKLDLEKYDIIISTTNDILLRKKNLCYVHYPIITSTMKLPIKHLFRAIFNKSVMYLLDLNANRKNSKFVTNSYWTKQQILNRTGKSSNVVYPMVTVRDKSFNTHKEKIVCIASRIAREKQIEKILDQAIKLIERGYTIKVIGPISDRQYHVELIRKYKNKDIQFMGKLSRDDYLNVMEKSRFYLHGMIDEHFGITIAEAAMMGCIPITHNSGGQIEISGVSWLSYDNYDEIIKIVDKAESQLNTLYERLKYRNLYLQKILKAEHAWKEILNLANEIRKK